MFLHGRGFPQSLSICVGLVSCWLASAPPAQAAYITRNVNVTLNAEMIEQYNLDVDLNGTIDFTFTAAFVNDPAFPVGFDTVDVPFASTNGVVVDSSAPNGFPTASLLNFGDTISSASLFSFGSSDQANLFFFTPFDPPSGNFEGRTGFLGFQFERPGGTLFGYAQITVNARDAAVNPLGLTIGSVTYSDTFGEPVQITPAPASIALFGIGCIGFLSTVRLRRGRGVESVP